MHAVHLVAGPVLAFGLAATPAQAVMRGEPARDPNGVRLSTVLIETPEGVCTGTVIGPDVVLTAGHCVSARGRYRVRYLDRNFRNVSVGVSRAVPHPNFDPRDGFAADDVGLIQISRAFSGDTRPAQLPRGGGLWGPASASSGQELLIAGFGSTERSNAANGRLREAIMRATEPSVPGRGFAGLVGSGGTPRSGMCVGDSGGPVYQRAGGSFVVVGVLKGGTTDRSRECTPRPIYTPIACYMPWIQSIAGSWGARLGAGIEMRQ